MDLVEYRDGLEAGIESLKGSSAEVQLLLVELERQRAEVVVVPSLQNVIFGIQGDDVAFGHTHLCFRDRIAPLASPIKSRLTDY